MYVSNELSKSVSTVKYLALILEKLFDNRLDSFIEKEYILSDNQYGFRKKIATSIDLLELIDKISS